jgi:hypothetical protein
MIAGASVIDGSFIVHWIITTALMLAIFFGIRYAIGSIDRDAGR